MPRRNSPILLEQRERLSDSFASRFQDSQCRFLKFSTPSGSPPQGSIPLEKDSERRWPGDHSKGEIEITGEEPLAFENEAVRLFNSTVRFPNGETGTHFRLAPSAGHEDGVVIAPIDEDGRLLLVRQFRHPTRMWHSEFPRGARNKGESPEDAARRELREEIGAEVIEIHPLGRVAPDTGQLTTVPFLFAARVKRSQEPEREDSEAIDHIVSVSFKELQAACTRGDVLDSFTNTGVLRLIPYFTGGRFKVPST